MERDTFNSNTIQVSDEVNEIFQRVWKRVIPDSQESPIVVDPIRCMKPEPFDEEPHMEQAMEPAVPNTGSPARSRNPIIQVLPQPAQSVRPAETDDSSSVTSHYKNDFPPRSAVPCLGSQNIHYEKLLQQMIRKELHNWLYYRTLARRAGGNAARVFASMVADNWLNAKRLSAAYFLISGVHLWPERSLIPSINSYLTALRERFIDEQQDAAQYIAVATECTDPCLSQLLMEIAEDSLHHAYQIRLLIEQL